MTHLPDTDLLGGLQRKDSQPGRDGRRWRVVAGVLAVLVGGGALVAGAAALADRVGSGDEGSGEGSAQTETSQTIGPVADFESFARGVDGVSDGDAAVVVQLVADTTGATPRGTADVLLTAAGENRITEVAAALTGWTSEAEAAGSIVLDVRLSTTDGAVDLSRPASANAERLAVASEVVADGEVDAFWIGALRVDLVVATGADQAQARDRWTERVREIAPAMAVTVRSADED